MRLTLSRLLLVLCFAASLARGAAEPSQEPKKTLLSTKAAIVLGLVEGITEFLPISSTGHLIITNELLGLGSEEPLKGVQGEALWYKRPSTKHPEGIPLTLKLAADTYTVVIQAGAILAVLFLYWGQVALLFKGLLQANSEGRVLLRNLLCAFVPVAVIGLLAHGLIDKHLFSVQAVIAAQISGAVLMLCAERWRRQRSPLNAGNKSALDLSPLEATGIGFMQCIALWPGMSRSMVTIVGGYFMGLRPDRAAEFSFLVGLPVLAGAAFVKGLKSGPAMIEVFGWDHVLLGLLVALFSAALAVKGLVAFLSRFGLGAFAYYRFLLAACLSLFFFA